MAHAINLVGVSVTAALAVWFVLAFDAWEDGQRTSCNESGGVYVGSTCQIPKIKVWVK